MRVDYSGSAFVTSVIHALRRRGATIGTDEVAVEFGDAYTRQDRRYDHIVVIQAGIHYPRAPSRSRELAVTANARHGLAHARRAGAMRRIARWWISDLDHPAATARPGTSITTSSDPGRDPARRRALAAGDVKLSVVIPARNEAETIEHTLREIADNLESLGIEHEIIVVDDASSDGTAFVVERTAAQDPRVRCLRSHFSHGFGFAVRSGLEVFQGDRAGYTAAAKCLADDHDALVVHLRYLTRHCAGGDRPICSKGRWARSNAGRR